MKVEKKNLNDALRVLGKVVCQTSPVELYRSVRFVGDETGVRAMATDGIETVAVAIQAEVESPVDFCVPYRELKELIRINRPETLDLTGKFIEFPAIRMLLPLSCRRTFASCWRMPRQLSIATDIVRCCRRSIFHRQGLRRPMGNNCCICLVRCRWRKM